MHYDLLTCGIRTFFQTFFTISSSTLVVYTLIILDPGGGGTPYNGLYGYAASLNLYKTRGRTNTGKQTISYVASVFWHNIPPYMKNLNVYQFSKQTKLYLFSEQLENS